MNDLIQILLKAEIDASSIGNIQGQIKKISESAQAIKINISIDNSALKSIENINKALTNVSSNTNLNNNFKNIANDVSMASKSLSDFKITNTKTFEDSAGKVKKYAETVKQAGVSITQTYSDIDKSKKISTVTDDKTQEHRLKQEIKDAKDLTSLIDQMAKGREKSNLIRERENKLIEQSQAKSANKNLEQDYNNQIKLVEQMAKAREKSILASQQAERKLEESQAKSANKNLEAQHKEAQNNIRINEGIKERIALYQKEQELKIKNMQGRYGSLLDSNALDQHKQKLSQLTAEMSNLGDKTTPNVSNKLKGFNLDLRQIETNAKNSKSALDLTNKSAMSFGESIKVAATKFMTWSIVTASYFATIREIRSGLKYVTEMDTALTEIAIVTGQNRGQVAGLAQEYNNLAKQMKVLTSDVSAGVVEFYRQGLSQDEVFERLKQNIQYAKISSLDYKQSAEILTATVNSMGVSIERASDVFALLGDSTATGADEIGIAFSKAGGSASALGVEFEKVASWIAVISAKTRESAESIGFSINTILSRMANMSARGFDEEDGTKINDVAKALSQVGIQLTDSSGNFRDFGKVMDEIGGKWDGLDNRTRSYLATTIAG